MVTLCFKVVVVGIPIRVVVGRPLVKVPLGFVNMNLYKVVVGLVGV